MKACEFGLPSWPDAALVTGSRDVRADLAHEVTHVLEVAIHAGEPHVGDLIDFDQAFHHEFANFPAGDFIVVSFVDFGLDGLHERADAFGADFTFPTRAFDTAGDFERIERFTTLVALDHANGGAFHAFDRGKATVAVLAATSPADRISIFVGSGVEHFVVIKVAEWAPHGR